MKLTHNVSRSFYSKSINNSNTCMQNHENINAESQLRPLPISFLIHFSELANHDLSFSIYLVIQKEVKNYRSANKCKLLKSAANAKTAVRTMKTIIKKKITWHNTQPKDSQHLV